MVWLQPIVSQVIPSRQFHWFEFRFGASIQVQVALGTTSSRREIRTEQPGQSVWFVCRVGAASWSQTVGFS